MSGPAGGLEGVIARRRVKRAAAAADLLFLLAYGPLLALALSRRDDVAPAVGIALLWFARWRVERRLRVRAQEGLVGSVVEAHR